MGADMECCDAAHSKLIPHPIQPVQVEFALRMIQGVYITPTRNAKFSLINYSDYRCFHMKSSIAHKLHSMPDTVHPVDGLQAKNYQPNTYP